MLGQTFDFFACSPSSPGFHCHSCHSGCIHQRWRRHHSPPSGHHQASRAQADTTGKEAAGPPRPADPSANQCANTGPEERALQDRIHRQHQVPAWRRKGRTMQTTQESSMNNSEKQGTCRDSWNASEWFSCISKWFGSEWFVIQIAAMCCTS